MDDYEKRLEQERKQAGLLMMRLDGIIKAVGFEPCLDNERDRSTRAYVRGKRADGACCAMEANTYGNKDRITFSAWTPSPDDGTSIKTPKQVTFSINKTDNELIKGIYSRYMAYFAPCMAEYEERFKKARAAEDAQDALVLGCARLMGYSIPERAKRRDKPRLYEYPESEHIKKVIVETDYHGTEARLELALSPAAAMLICAKLGEWLKKEGAEKCAVKGT